MYGRYCSLAVRNFIGDLQECYPKLLGLGPVYLNFGDKIRVGETKLVIGTGTMKQIMATVAIGMVLVLASGASASGFDHLIGTKSFNISKPKLDITEPGFDFEVRT